jgi:hypothetical protein
MESSSGGENTATAAAAWDELAGSLRIRMRRSSKTNENWRKRSKKQPAEQERSILAILDTCLSWPDERVSVRSIWESPLLAEKRSALELDSMIGLTTVQDQLKYLASRCGVDSLVNTEEKRQFSRFRPGIKDKLQEIRPILVKIIEKLQEEI